MPFKIEPPAFVGYTSDAHFCEFDNNEFGLLVDLRVNFASSCFYVGKFSSKDSNIWSRYFFSSTTADFRPYNLVRSSPSSLILPGHFCFSTSSCSSSGKGSCILKIDEQTGNLIGSKSYCYPSGEFSSCYGNTCIINISSKSIINTFSLNADSGVLNIVCIKYDTLLNAISSKVIKKDPYIDFASKSFNTNKNGTFIYGLIDPNNVTNKFYGILDSNYNLLQERKVHFDSLPMYADGNVGSINNNEKAFLLYEVKHGNKSTLDFIKTSAYNCDTTCVGSPSNIFRISNFPLTLNNDNYLQNDTCSIITVPFQLYPQSVYLQKQVFCQSINNLKDSVKIKGASRICRIDTNAIYVAQGVGKCSGVRWSIDTLSHSVINVINDTTVSIKFTKPWSGFLYAFSQKNSSVKDSVKLTVLKVDTIRFLPPDTSICANNNITLIAGNGFSAYLWNTGDTTSTIVVSQKRIYIVKASLSSGCFILDTFSINQVYPIPSVALDSSKLWCKGKYLDAGQGFLKYLWQDNSVNQVLPANQAGKYWVQVKDSNNCFGSDTTLIIAIVDTPFNFLKADTTICQYDNVLLLPTKLFSSYQWSTGATSAGITVSDEGTYSLSVIDSKRCIGKDKIIVRQKKCTNTLIFPSAFSPNKDGKNDILRPYKTGVLIYYDFAVYNRWGQKVFETNKPEIGWSGSNTGEPATVFVWMCNYQFAGEPFKIQKGTITLIK